MASKSEGGGKDDINFIKDKFTTREGTYILAHWSEYTKPTRLQTSGSTNTPVRASFINVSGDPSPERICFNIGKELYVYVYKGVKKAADLTKPVDRRVYKATLPTCHDFNKIWVSKESLRLLVGFSHGQIQVTDPMRKEISSDPLKRELNKFFNEEKLIDKSKVTCIKWIPGQPDHFLVSYASGQLYVYNDELPCGPTPPTYQPFKQGDGYSIHTCKTKSTRNPLYRWVIGQGAINEFAFSPCARYLAVVSQDGFLRVFHYDSMELVGSMRSYFGGLLCVCWSPDSKFLVCGGEDDLVTVYSFNEKRVVCRGQGHRSWVSVVAFDPYTSVFSSDNSELRNGTKVQDVQATVANGNQSNHQKPPADLSQTSLQSSGSCVTTYRFGSVGQDTFLCLWDLTEDVIQQPINTRTRTSILLSNPNSVSATLPRCNNVQKTNSLLSSNDISGDGNAHPVGNSVMGNSTHHFATLSLGERKEITEKKEHKRNFSLSSKSSEKNNMLKSNHVKHIDESIKVLGTCSCPRLDEVPLLEPIVCEKISSERLTELVFREDCIVTACQEGIVNTWARPGRVALTQHRAFNPQTPTGETYPVQ